MLDSAFLRFARHGTWLLLAGLLTGFGMGKFHSHHLANAAHVTGLIGGFGLIAVGALWSRLTLGPRWSQIGAWTFIISMQLSWLGLVLKGALGSGSDAPLNTLGPGAGSWDAISGLVLVVAAILAVAATVVLLVGLRQNRQGGGAVGAA
jgi:hypothetical protein